jgi:hypothetical protein
MENKKLLTTKFIVIAAVILVAVVSFLLGSNRYLLTSLFPSDTNTNSVRGDIYIPQNYSGSAGQQGEVEVRVGKQLSNVAGISFTVNYPVDYISLYDASNTGLSTSSFLLVKNTNTPGTLNVSMVQANGIDLPLDTVVLKISADIKSTVAQGTNIPLTISNVSVLDQSLNAIPVTAQNGNIIINGGNLNGSEPYIQSIVPDYALSSVDTPIVIHGKNLPGSVSSVKIGDVALTSVQDSAGQITGTVPKGIAAGVYSVSITGTSGTYLEKKNAFTIVEEAEGLSIDGKASYFSPPRVKNDNTMTTTLWVKVDDLHGVEDIEYVDVNLDVLGGKASNRMTADKIVDKSQWFYLSGITVPSTVATSDTPYNVTVTATNRLGKVSTTTVSITVIGDVEVNLKPVVRQAYTTPPFLDNNGKTTFTVYAYVTDDDGADKLSNVVVDLSPLGNGTVTLSKDGNAVGNGFWFKSDNTLTVSPQIVNGSYPITVTASNTTGDSNTGTFQATVGSKNVPIVSTDSYVAPNRVPADGTTKFSVYGLVTDQDGMDDIDKVTVSFDDDLNLSPKEMTKGAESGDGNWFEAKDMILPTTVYKGSHQLKITATDKEGNSGYTNVELYVVSPDDVKNAPKIDSTRSYTTPYAVANDGSTNVDLYAYVTDPDGNDDIDTVNVDLRAIGLKPVNQMTKDQPEGKGLWFKFSTKVPAIIAPSSDPYELVVSATDKSGAVGQGKIYLKVLSTNPNTIVAPQMEAAVPTSATSIEVVFNKALDPMSVDQAGANFQIFDRNDIKQTLRITSATLNTRNNIVILQTDTQEASRPYTVVVDTRVKDSQGTTLKTNYGDRVDFRGYVKDFKAPAVRLVSSTSQTTVEVMFYNPIKPSSISLQGDDTKIWDIDNAVNLLKVNSVHFKDGNTLILNTDKQAYAKNYGLKILNIENSSGIKEGAIEVFFKGYVTSMVGDLNGDGKIDFNDFTIFADVYRKAQGYGSGNDSYIDQLNNNMNTNTNTNNNS